MKKVIICIAFFSILLQGCVEKQADDLSQNISSEISTEKESNDDSQKNTEKNTQKNTEEDTAGMQYKPGELISPDEIGQEVFSIHVGDKIKGSLYDLLNNSNNGTFVYVYNDSVKSSRLVLFCENKSDCRWVTMIILEPEWEGLKKLCESVNVSFGAEVVGILNISFEEGQIYIPNCVKLTEEVIQSYKKTELIDILHPEEIEEKEGLQIYMGAIADESEYRVMAYNKNHWQWINDSEVISLFGGTLENVSEGFQKSIDVFMRTIKRFKLQEEIGL